MTSYLEQTFFNAAIGAAEWAKIARGTVDLKARFDQHDIVLGVIRDPSEPRGFACPILKGTNLLRESIASGSSVTARIAGVPCGSWAEAEAMKHVFGDGSGGGAH